MNDRQQQKEQVLAYPIASILEKAGIRVKSKGNIMVARCPVHAERTPSFTVFLKDNTCHCFGCKKGGDGIWLVQKLFKVEYPEAVRMIEGFIKDLSPDDYKSMIQKSQGQKARAEADALPDMPTEQEQEAYKKFFDRLEFVKPGDEAYEYLITNKDRKFSPEVIKKMNIRWVKDTRHLRNLARQYPEVFYGRRLYKLMEPGTVIFPFFQDGKLLYLQGREIHPKVKKQKYVNVAGPVPCLFAADHVKDAPVVFLAEGQPDCLSLWTNGYPAIGMVSTIFKEDWLPLLKNKTVIIAIDDDGRFNDDEGAIDTPVYQEKIQKLLKVLKKGENIRVAAVHFPINWDANDFLVKKPGYKFEVYFKALSRTPEQQKTPSATEISMV